MVPERAVVEYCIDEYCVISLEELPKANEE
jgi:hypothetical protein